MLGCRGLIKTEYQRSRVNEEPHQLKDMYRPPITPTISTGIPIHIKAIVLSLFCSFCETWNWKESIVSLGTASTSDVLSAGKLNYVQSLPHTLSRIIIAQGLYNENATTKSKLTSSDERSIKTAKFDRWLHWQIEWVWLLYASQQPRDDHAPPLWGLVKYIWETLT